MRIFHPLSNSTTIFDTGGETTRYEDPPDLLLLPQLLLPLGAISIAAALLLTSFFPCARRLALKVTASSPTMGGRAPWGVHSCANDPICNMHNLTVFDREIELVGELASRCLTELTPAWLMAYVLLRYLALISLSSPSGTSGG